MLKVGVIGVGHLGRHHARIYAAHAGAELIGVSDSDQNAKSPTSIAFPFTKTGEN
jgi:predicted dehydrogenase